MSEHVQPWDRQRDDNGELEPMLWFNRFDRFYRPAGPERSLLGANNAWRKSENKRETKSISGPWFTNAEEWHWKDRAEAWDMEQRRQRLIEEARERAEMQRRHSQLARGLQTAGGKRLRELVDNPAELTVGEARQYVKEGIALERQASGLPEHLIAVAGMTDDELLSRYHQLLAGIGGVGSGDDEAGDDPAEDPADTPDATSD